MHCSTSQKIGIIGDGQLALMLAEALTKKERNFLCLGSSSSSPMEKLFPEYTTRDEELFRASCSVFVLENEFLSTKDLAALLREKTSALFPDVDSYAHFQNKVAQRTLFDRLGIPAPRWMPLYDFNDVRSCLEKFDFPFVLKASAGGYDGKGVRVIHTLSDFEKGLKEFGYFEGRELLVEERVRIRKEVAQGFLRRSDGTSTFLPLVHTVQADGVCNIVLYPAQVEEKTAAAIREILRKLIDHGLTGIFNFEFFVDEDDRVFINEGAPRPHNSQHLTIDASTSSQFDLLASYLCGETGIPAEVQTLPAAMVNVLGQSSSTDYRLELPQLDESLSVHPKLYGKEKCLPGRKMGHVNIVDRSARSDLLSAARKLFKEYQL